jgi:hypothetical protein
MLAQTSHHFIIERKETMTDKHTPKYFITELNDGIQWLTDGLDFGMRADAAPELLKALKALMPWMGKALADDAFARATVPLEANRATERARATIEDAEGGA